MADQMDIEAFAAEPSLRQGRLIGLDLGTKTIGIALSDGLQSVASAHHTLARRKFGQDAQALLDLASEMSAVGFAIGWPINMDGSVGPRAQATGAFIRNMASKTALPFITWDERLSTVAAERVMLEADLSRAKRAEHIDAAAAAHILQGVLDRLRHLRAAYS